MKNIKSFFMKLEFLYREEDFCTPLFFLSLSQIDYTWIHTGATDWLWPGWEALKRMPKLDHEGDANLL